MRAALPFAALAALAGPAAAHPHVFVDTAMEVVLDGDRLLGVRMTWTYDEFFSLLLTEDLGLDPDGDAQLTDAELRALADHVGGWPPGFEGDLAVSKDSATLPLAPRAEHAVAWRDARVVETHFRPLAEPVPAHGALIQNFDPYYYVAYTVADPVAVAGGPCAARLAPADLGAAQAEVDALYEDLDVAGAPADVQLPPVGFAFSDTVELSCAG